MVCFTEAAALSTASVTVCMALPAAVRLPVLVCRAISGAGSCPQQHTLDKSVHIHKTLLLSVQS